jgi:copper resistance protein B
VAGQVKLARETLLTNRLIIEPEIEANVYSQADARRDRAAGLADFEASLRLRYEIIRKFAPYVGVVWVRSGLTGHIASQTRGLVGLRMWF